MDNTSRVRISCASLCRIVIDGQYLLLLNKNRRTKAAYQLSPVGGAITIDDWSLLADYDYVPEKTASMDLRLKLAVNQVPQFRTWFHTRQGRERSPFRELYEELVTEAGALTDLRRDDVRVRFLRIVEDSKQTIRKGLTGEWTNYFFEIFEVNFAASDVVLQLKSAPANRGLVWVDEATARAAAPLHMVFDGAEREVGLMTEYLFKDEED